MYHEDDTPGFRCPHCKKWYDDPEEEHDVDACGEDLRDHLEEQAELRAEDEAMGLYDD